MNHHAVCIDVIDVGAWDEKTFAIENVKEFIQSFRKPDTRGWFLLDFCFRHISRYIISILLNFGSNGRCFDAPQFFY